MAISDKLVAAALKNLEKLLINKGFNAEGMISKFDFRILTIRLSFWSVRKIAPLLSSFELSAPEKSEKDSCWTRE